MQMVLTIMVTGLMTNSMDSAWSHGQMVPSTRETTLTGRKKEKESSLLLTAATTRENSDQMKYADKASTIGLMESNMMESGAAIKCMDREPLSGKTKRSILVNSSTTNVKEKEHSAGPMDAST
jgi:hypothetical protein